MAAVSFFLIHGAMLWAVWTFFGLWQVASNRYLKHHWQSNMWFHRVGGTVVLVTTLLYGLVGWKKVRPIKDDVHAPMGVTVTCVVFFLVLSGVATRVKLVKSAENQNKVLCFKKFHKAFAYFMLVMSQITIFFGIYSYTHNRDIDTVLHYVSITLFIVLFGTLEFFHQRFLRQDPIKFNEPLNVMGDEEFQMEVVKGRQKLVILDDLVLDVTQFAEGHPGGAFLLNKNVGRDISKYFHGGYAYEPISGAANHAHSNYARKIVNSLIVARYVGKRDSAIMSTKASSPVSSGISTFTMQVRGQSKLPTQFKNFYPDLDFVGKHFLVQAQDHDGKVVGEARQYTVASTMEPALYAQYVKGLADPATFNEADLVQQIVKNQDADDICLTLKRYPVGGLSERIHSAENNSLFRVSGPLGRSFSIDTTGLNVVFAAGTGILPFMDLVGFIARQTLNVNQFDKTKLQSGFYLWFCARLNSQELIGDELLSALESTGNSQFKYDVMRKDSSVGAGEQSQRWDVNSIEAKLTQIMQSTAKIPVNIWVCGTPSMNQTFEAAYQLLVTRNIIKESSTKLHIL